MALRPLDKVIWPVTPMLVEIINANFQSLFEDLGSGAAGTTAGGGLTAAQIAVRVSVRL